MACRLINSLTRFSDIRSRGSRLWLQAFCACVSAWIAQTGCACTELSSLQLLETAQHNTLILCGFCEPNLITAETFWKAAERFQCTSDAIAAFVQVLHMTNHTMLGFNQHKMIKSHVVIHQWSRINDCHLWLASIFHWWLMSSHVITSDSPNHHSVNQRSTTHTLLFIVTHMLHKGVCVCLVICLQLGNKSTRHTPDHFSVCEVTSLNFSLASISLEKLRCWNIHS